jgi:predicted nucleic acid-binding protein
MVLLDTSARFALLENEAGADVVEAHLLDARDRRLEVHASFATLTEVEYITTQERNAGDAANALAKIKTWPVHWHHSDDALCGEAAKLKATYKLSFADAFVAATAKRLGAVLVHKDPEFTAVAGVVKQRMLPPKGGQSS